MNWLYYLLEANIYVSVFYLLYCLFLNKETHYTLNRLYLLSSCLLAFVLPFFQLGRLKPVGAASLTMPAVSNIAIYAAADAPGALTAAPALEAPTLTLQDYLIYIYVAGAVVLLMLLLLKLYRLLKLTRIQQQEINSKYKLVYLPDADTAFSFFNYLFIGTRTAGRDTIIRHELVHIRQKHSADLFFLELFKIINWFNPLVYLLQNSLKTVHEYIADQETATGENDTLSYSSFLIDNAYGIGGSSVTHSFFNYNLLKKRIIMLNKKRSGNLARLKYLLAFPVCAGLLCASTLGFSKNYGYFDLAPAGKPMLKANVQSHVSNTRRADSVVKTVSKYTKKGVKFTEDGYLINGKANFRVIIKEKDGNEKEYFRNQATPGEIKMLRDKYGYGFPTMNIFSKLPPPPPMPPAPKVGVTKRPPPPPPAPPVGKPLIGPPPPPAPPKNSKLKYLQDTVVKMTAPANGKAKISPASKASPAMPVTVANVPINGQIKHDATVRTSMPANMIAVQDVPLNGQSKYKLSAKTVIYKVPEGQEKTQFPLVIVNGKKYEIKDKISSGQSIYFKSSDSTIAHGPNDPQALKKWGNDAGTGLVELYGKDTSVIIR